VGSLVITIANLLLSSQCFIRIILKILTIFYEVIKQLVASFSLDHQIKTELPYTKKVKINHRMTMLSAGKSLYRVDRRASYFVFNLLFYHGMSATVKQARVRSHCRRKTLSKLICVFEVILKKFSTKKNEKKQH